MPFFPDWPPLLNHALVLGVLLAAGATLGEIAQRARLPSVFGYILAGLLIGPIAFNLPVKPLLVEARVVVDIALGLILFELGRRLDFRWLRLDASLWIASSAEIVMSFAAMAGALTLFGFPPVHAAVAAAIGVSTSPAVAWLVARDERAEGQVTERCLNLVAINSLVSFLLVTMLVSAVHLKYEAGWLAVVAHPLYLLLGSLAVGIGAGFVLLYAGSALAKRREVHFGIIVAAVLITVGIATALKLSVFLALLATGAAVRNGPRRFALLEFDLGGGARVLYILLFVITGASLPLSMLQSAGWAAVAFVLARAAGKWVGAMLSAPLSPLPIRQNALLGLTLMPMSGVALIMMHDIATLYPEFGDRLGSVLLVAIIVFELSGPLLLQRALKMAGDIRPA